MEIVNIDGEHLHIFGTTWGISINFSGRILLMIISKVKKNNKALPLSLENIFLEKLQREKDQIDPLQPF